MAEGFLCFVFVHVGLTCLWPGRTHALFFFSASFQGEPRRVNYWVVAMLAVSGWQLGAGHALRGEFWVSIVVQVVIPDLPSALTVVLGQEQLARAENINTSPSWPLSFSFHVGLGNTPERAKTHNEPGNYQPPWAGSKQNRAPRCG